MVLVSRIFKSKIFRFIINLLPFALACFLIFQIFSGTGLTLLEFAESYEPENVLLVTLSFLLMYALKSMSIIFPMPALFIAAGILYEPFYAVLVSLAGVFVECTIPYCFTRLSGHSFADPLIKKRPKIKAFLQAQSRHPWFLSYFLRTVRVFPADLVSMLLGSLKLPFLPYITGSMAGILPIAIFTTLIGTAITDPASPMFIVSIVMTVLITAVSLIANYFYQKKRDEVVILPFHSLFGKEKDAEE